MTLDDIRKIQERINQKKQQPKKVREEIDMDAFMAETKALDEKRKYKRTTPEQRAENKKQEELKAMLEYQEKKPDEEQPKQKYEGVIHDPSKEWDVKIGDKIEYFDPTLSYELTGYRPITKDEGLDFDPKLFTVAADTYRRNKRYTSFVEGTFKHIQHWKEEFNRCLNGYTVGKYRLTGENYFWLNYYRLQSVISTGEGQELRNEDFPGFINKQYEYFHYIELVRKLKRDGVAFKSRGVGASEIAASNCAHAYTFHKASRNVVTAYDKAYIGNTLSKVWVCLNFLNTCTEGAFRRVRMKIDTEERKRASKVDQDRNESGWMSEIYGVVHDQPRKLRGDRVYSLYFEEAGSDPQLEETYIQSEALVKILGRRVGSRFVFGTSGEESSYLATLKKMFYNPEEFDVLPYKNTYGKDQQVQFTGYFIPSYTMWFGDDKGNIGFDSRGVVDEERAKKHYQEIFDKVQDPNILIRRKAEFCFTPEDAFILEGSNRFDRELLLDQYQALTIHRNVEKPKPVKLHWGHTDTGDVDRKSKPTIEFTDKSPLQIVELPMTDENGLPYTNLYVAGIDSIDADKSTSSGQTDVSDFCMVVMRRQFGLQPPKVVAIYKERPNHIKTAFDTALKLCQYYNCKALIEATRVSIKQHFENNGALGYLMRRPRATVNTTTRTNLKQYGVPASGDETSGIIGHQLDLIEQYIVDYSDQIQFPDMLDELIRYSYANKRKFDIVAAFAMCLLANEDMQGRVAKPSGGGTVRLQLGYVRNEYGQMEYKQIEEDYYDTRRTAEATGYGSYRMHILGMPSEEIGYHDRTPGRPMWLG